MKPAILFAAAIAMSATSAAAQDVCMSAPELEASLKDWYGEQPVDGSQTDTTTIWASEQTGTWTLVQYLADGQSCVLAQGYDWGAEVSEDLVVAALTEQP
ncbi:S-adenosyl-L-homocysteine hydrolase [uncultured Tateyamaria sp.]|uniref:S-adenosyl-L-homocysteine hydrolase n=1 Tax=uncultured Tateyamaria sp. TaxID=455651 RepID=UPI002625038F|nr:S-adenosyl-L-homocysteine hydrolase [uncultured Tateyamaria sp.]